MKTYSEKLKDPRWQKKRLEIFERDSWSCRECFEKTETLHVHHGCYIKGRDPWDYDNELLVTLCEDCHQRMSLSRAKLDLRLSSLPSWELENIDLVLEWMSVEVFNGMADGLRCLHDKVRK